jgi:hypothetical protein
VTLTRSCDVAGALEVPSDQAGTRRYEFPTTLLPRFSDVRTYVFAGGCATYAFSFPAGAPPTLAFDVDKAVTFMPRAVLVSAVARGEGLALCGRGATCPG